ncbi:hypothetical protein ABK040_015596 [Willaertia magna]
MSKNNTKLFSVGRNENSQLARPESGLVGEITEIEGIDHLASETILRNIKQLASGRSHFIITTNDNRIFSCGNNNYNQCGFPDGIASVQKLEEIPKFPKYKTIDHIGCGWFHSIIVVDKNKVICAGHSYFGQTFNVPEQDYFSLEYDPIPKGIMNLKEDDVITQVSCSTFSTSLIVNGWKIITCGEITIPEDKDGFAIGCEMFKENKLKYYKHLDSGILAICRDNNIYVANKNDSFKVYLQNIPYFRVGHMHDRFFYRKENDFKFYEGYISENQLDEDRHYLCLQPIFAKYGVNAIEFCVGNFQCYIVVNKKQFYKLNEELDQLELLVDVEKETYTIKSIATGAANAYCLVIDNTSKSEERMKQLLFKNVKFADITIL